DVPGEGEEGSANQTEREPLAVLVDPREVPNNDHRGKDLDEGVEAKPRQGNRARRERREHDDHGADDVPTQGKVLEEPAAFEQGVFVHRSVHESNLTASRAMIDGLVNVVGKVIEVNPTGDDGAL